MTSLDTLPADQRAVLQLVLQRGRSYDEIARLLSIDPGAVRERALSAFDALGPQTGVPAPQRGLIADYLLGQLDPEAAAETRERIAESPSERAWARVVASELAPLAGEALPEIPSTPSAPVPPPPAQPSVPPPAEKAPSVPSSAADESPAPHAPVPAPAEAPFEPADEAAGGETEAEPESRRSRRRGRRERKPLAPPVSVGKASSGRRSSRLGGTLLIALTLVIVAAVVIILLSTGTSKSPNRTASTGSTPAASPPAAASGTTTGTGTAAAKVVAQINLTPPKAGSKSAGIAEVLKEGATDGIAIVAQNVPPNTTRPPNAYAVWLYNSPTDAHLLGFVNPGVGANGRLSTAGGLPTNASHFKQLIVTLETKASPTSPGTIILQGTLTGL
jgi:hypothetical protein